ARGDCRKRLFWTSRIRATRSHKSFAVVFVTLLFGYREMNQPSPELGQQRRQRSLPSWRELGQWHHRQRQPERKVSSIIRESTSHLIVRPNGADHQRGKDP